MHYKVIITVIKPQINFSQGLDYSDLTRNFETFCNKTENDLLYAPIGHRDFCTKTQFRSFNSPEKTKNK